MHLKINIGYKNTCRYYRSNPERVAYERLRFNLFRCQNMGIKKVIVCINFDYVHKNTIDGSKHMICGYFRKHSYNPTNIEYL